MDKFKYNKMLDAFLTENKIGNTKAARMVSWEGSSLARGLRPGRHQEPIGRLAEIAVRRHG